MLPGQMTNEALYKPKTNNFLQGPPVVTAIQAIDQYGNVLAQAQNPKAFQMMQL